MTISFFLKAGQLRQWKSNWDNLDGGCFVVLGITRDVTQQNIWICDSAGKVYEVEADEVKILSYLVMEAS